MLNDFQCLPLYKVHRNDSMAAYKMYHMITVLKSSDSHALLEIELNIGPLSAFNTS